MWIPQKVYVCVFYFNFCPTPTLLTVFRTICASGDVFTPVAISTDDINSKASPVRKPQPDKIPDVTKNPNIAASPKSIGVGGKRKESGRNYSYAACPWMYRVINCTGKALTEILCSVLDSQYEMNNKLEREQQSRVQGPSAYDQKGAAEGTGLV